MKRSQFFEMHDGDVMAVDKLKQGVDSFAEDQARLEALLGQLAAEQQQQQQQL